MTGSDKSQRTNSRWLKISVLLCAAMVLPLGIANAQDYEAVERRLGEAVAEGELSLKQAAAMMDTLKKVSHEKFQPNDEEIAEDIGHWLKSVGDEIKQAAKQGKITEEQAWEKWHYVKEKQLAPKLKGLVKTGKISEQTAWAIWKGVEKAEAGEKLKAAVAKGEMTEEEAWEKWREINREEEECDEEEDEEEDKDDDGDDEDDEELEERREAKFHAIKGHFNRLGIDERTFDHVLKRLDEKGIDDDQMTDVLGGMLRVIHGMKAQGEDFELDRRLKHYFKNAIELSDEQLETVLRLSRRISHNLRRNEQGEREED